jgi:hypothetical protein
MKQKMKTLMLSLMLTAATLTAGAQQHYENRGFKALMNGKIPVEVMFQTTQNQDGEWMTAGYLYYPKAKNPAPILIVEGWYPEKQIVSKDEDETVSRFTEYQPDGERTGILYVTYVEVEGDFQMRRASWKNPTTGKVLQLSKFEEIRELPSWYPGAPKVLSAATRLEWQTKERVYSSEGPNSEWLDRIEVDFLERGKKVFTVKEDMSGAISKDLLTKGWEWVTNEDINFDGTPDVLIYVGMQPNGNTLNKAYVWNPYTRQFYPVPEFDEIQEPDIDRKTKTITSRARDYQNAYIDTFKWKNGKLKRVATKKLPLH